MHGRKGEIFKKHIFFYSLAGGFSRKVHPVLGMRREYFEVKEIGMRRRALQSERRVKINVLLLSGLLVEPSVFSLVRSPRTRFRWIQSNYTMGADSWAIDNVVLASGCPWMCSGRGICDAGRCV